MKSLFLVACATGVWVVGCGSPEIQTWDPLDSVYEPNDMEAGTDLTKRSDAGVSDASRSLGKIGMPDGASSPMALNVDGGLDAGNALPQPTAHGGVPQEEDKPTGDTASPDVIDLTDDELRTLNPSKIKKWMIDDIRKLELDPNGNPLPQSRIRLLGRRQTQAIDPNVIGQMTGRDFESFEDPQAGYLLPEQVNAVSPDGLSALFLRYTNGRIRPDPTKELAKGAVGKIKPPHIRRLSASNGDFLNTLEPSQIHELKGEQLRVIRTPSFDWTNAGWSSHLTDDQFNSLSVDQYKAGAHADDGDEQAIPKSKFELLSNERLIDIYLDCVATGDYSFFADVDRRNLLTDDQIVNFVNDPAYDHGADRYIFTILARRRLWDRIDPTKLAVILGGATSNPDWILNLPIELFAHLPDSIRLPPKLVKDLSAKQLAALPLPVFQNLSYQSLYAITAIQSEEVPAKYWASLRRNQLTALRDEVVHTWDRDVLSEMEMDHFLPVFDMGPGYVSNPNMDPLQRQTLREQRRRMAAVAHVELLGAQAESQFEGLLRRLGLTQIPMVLPAIIEALAKSYGPAFFDPSQLLSDQGFLCLNENQLKQIPAPTFSWFANRRNAPFRDEQMRVLLPDQRKTMPLF